MAENAKGSPERFGYSWARFSELTPEQEQQFLMWMADLPMEKDWAGTRFLDVGCGAGRNSYWAMKHGATSGVACDLDERSLAAARVNLEEFPTVDVRSVSVYDLPFKNEFDIAFSIGVIHHLADPICAVSKMIDAVRPGGTVLRGALETPGIFRGLSTCRVCAAGESDAAIPRRILTRHRVRRRSCASSGSSTTSFGSDQANRVVRFPTRLELSV